MRRLRSLLNVDRWMKKERQQQEQEKKKGNK